MYAVIVRDLGLVGDERTVVWGCIGCGKEMGTDSLKMLVRMIAEIRHWGYCNDCVKTYCCRCGVGPLPEQHLVSWGDSPSRLCKLCEEDLSVKVSACLVLQNSTEDQEVGRD